MNLNTNFINWISPWFYEVNVLYTQRVSKLILHPILLNSLKMQNKKKQQNKEKLLRKRSSKEALVNTQNTYSGLLI